MPEVCAVSVSPTSRLLGSARDGRRTCGRTVFFFQCRCRGNHHGVASQRLGIARIVGEGHDHLDGLARVSRHQGVCGVRCAEYAHVARPAAGDPLVGEVRVVQPVGVRNAGGLRRQRLAYLGSARDGRRTCGRTVFIGTLRAGHSRGRRVRELPPVLALRADRPGDPALAPRRQRDRHVPAGVGLHRHLEEVAPVVHPAAPRHAAPGHRERILAQRAEADPDVLAERHPEADRARAVVLRRHAHEARRQRRRFGRGSRRSDGLGMPGPRADTVRVHRLDPVNVAFVRLHGVVRVPGSSGTGVVLDGDEPVRRVYLGVAPQHLVMGNAVVVGRVPGQRYRLVRRHGAQSRWPGGDGFRSRRSDGLGMPGPRADTVRVHRLDPVNVVFVRLHGVVRVPGSSGTGVVLDGDEPVRRVYLGVAPQHLVMGNAVVVGRVPGQRYRLVRRHGAQSRWPGGARAVLRCGRCAGKGQEQCGYDEKQDGGPLCSAVRLARWVGGLEVPRPRGRGEGRFSRLG